ncbi:MAG: hypothetical protein ACOYKZ_03800, partial [Chlamydiia bacterium]
MFTPNSLTAGHGTRIASQAALSAQRPSPTDDAPLWATLNEFVMPISQLTNLGFHETVVSSLADGYQRLLDTQLYAFLTENRAPPDSSGHHFGLTLAGFIGALGEALRETPYLADIELCQLYWDHLVPILEGRAPAGETRVLLTLLDRNAMQPLQQEEWNLRLAALNSAVRSACKDPGDLLVATRENYAVACHSVEEEDTVVVEMPLQCGDHTTQRLALPVRSTRQVIYALPRLERQHRFCSIEGNPEGRGYGSVIFNITHAKDQSHRVQIQLGLPAPTMAIDELAFDPIPDPSLGPCLLSQTVPVERVLGAARLGEIVLCQGASTRPHALALAIRRTLGGCRVSDEVKAELIEAYKAH